MDSTDNIIDRMFEISQDVTSCHEMRCQIQCRSPSNPGILSCEAKLLNENEPKEIATEPRAQSPGFFSAFCIKTLEKLVLT